MNRRDFLHGFVLLPTSGLWRRRQGAGRETQTAGTGRLGETQYQSSDSDPRAVPDSGWPMYQGDAAGNVYGLDSESGDEIWRFETVGEIESTGPAMTEELVIAGSSGGTIYGLDVQTGEERWRLETGQAFDPMALSGGTLFVLAGLDVIAIRTGSDQETSDTQQTGDAETASQPSGDAESTGASGDATGGAQDADGRQRGFFSNSGNEPAQFDDAGLSPVSVWNRLPDAGG